MKFLTYLNKRGGKPVFTDIKKPEKNDWGSGKDAMNDALSLEKLVNEVCILSEYSNPCNINILMHICMKII